MAPSPFPAPPPHSPPHGSATKRCSLALQTLLWLAPLLTVHFKLFSVVKYY